MTATVHIVDDEEVIRDSLSWLLQSADLDCRLWDSGEAFLDALPIDGIATVILDVRLGGLSGPTVYQTMLDRGSDVPVIFLTGHADVPLAVDALKRGAFDFVEKPFNDNRLIEIVRAALAHHGQIRAAATGRAELAARHATLTPRERQVMDLMLRGQMNKQIASELNLAIRTVEVHRARILDKFGVRSIAELASIAGRLNIGR